MHMGHKSWQKYVNESIDRIFEMPHSFFLYSERDLVHFCPHYLTRLPSHYCLGLLLDKQQFQIARFIAHKINPLNDVSKQWSQASGTNFTDQYLHSYSVREKSQVLLEPFFLVKLTIRQKPVLAKSFALNQQKNIDLVLYKNLVKWHSQLRVVLLILWTGRTVEMLELCKFNNVCKSRHQQFDAHGDSPYLNASKI